MLRAMDLSGWTAVAAVATACLALGTFLLAGATVWVRRRDEEDRRRSAFRSALVALLDACRLWASVDPTSSPDSAQRLTDYQLRLEAVDALLAQVTVPPPLLARLLWYVSQAKTEGRPPRFRGR